MNKRKLLRTLISDAWEECIIADYCKQRINSERSLQASLWSHISKKLNDNRRLFIEPGIRVKIDGCRKIIRPDFVITHHTMVIGVIEIKYSPRGKPNYHKDIESLATLAENRDRIVMNNIRYRGNVSERTQYTLSKNVLFVWAGVHAETNINDRNKLTPDFASEYPELRGCYLELHAETRYHDDPVIFSRSS